MFPYLELLSCTQTRSWTAHIEQVTQSSTARAAATTTATSTTCDASVETCACDPADAACNYCAFALAQIDNCTAAINEAGLDVDSISDCLCYEIVTDETYGDFGVWSPNYFDAAFASCPLYARTAAPADVKDLASATRFCNGQGDYYTMGYTDAGTYRLAIATPASVSSFSSSRSAQTASSGSTSQVVAATTSATASAKSTVAASTAPVASSLSGAHRPQVVSSSVSEQEHATDIKIQQSSIAFLGLTLFMLLCGSYIMFT
jgi:hypothetical protein